VAVRTFQVSPSLPKDLTPLWEIVHNLMWTWDHEAISLFRRIDSAHWETCGHNPVLFLGTVRQERLEELTGDDGFLAHLHRVNDTFDAYLKERTWFEKEHGKFNGPLVAYFSAEYGLTECLPIYSGGLGVLSGDHLKSASELGVPMVGVGLLYQEGYFRQYLTADGWQQERYPRNDFYRLPVLPVKGLDGRWLKIELDYPGRTVQARIIRVRIGRLSLYMLDTNLPENSAQDRRITNQLYGGDNEMRIQQEIMLGIGGHKALRLLGLKPAVYHMNEGHSAFSGLERARELMEAEGVSFAEAIEATAAGTAFTTHTPVPAGIDEFSPGLIEKYFGDYREKLGLTRDEFLALGRKGGDGDSSPFNMAYLALRLSRFVNGVSRLHARVSRRMWAHRWPGVPEEEVPIGHITNGVHIRSWISSEMSGLLLRYLGPDWVHKPAGEEIWERVDNIPDEELWRTHELRRERLVAYVRHHLHDQLKRRGLPQAVVDQAREVLHPEALTIGFARRFATYKRAALLLKDPERLEKLLSDTERPMQIIFAGKAHPRDDGGKELIRQIVQFARREDSRNRIVFVEDYDIAVARYLVQGVDMWLNTPRRPLEASGTSGMKVLANGGLNLSVLDGWWAEGYSRDVGWAIGRGEEYDDQELQDQIESNALYDLLEQDIVPLYYDRSRDGLPRGWIAMMKRSMRELCPRFNTNHMVKEYTENAYMSSLAAGERMLADGASRARALAGWKKRVTDGWDGIGISDIEAHLDGEISVGDEVQVRATVDFGKLSPDDVSVEVYVGLFDGEIIENGTAITMSRESDLPDGRVRYTGVIPCRTSGRHGFRIRVLPRHVDLATPFDLARITWA
jgi:starch phosphorylase